MHSGYDKHAWKLLRLQILERDGYRCRSCGKAGRFEVDHIRSLANGGEFWNAANLQTLCRECHFRKTASEIGKQRDKVNRTEWIEYRDMLEYQTKSQE